MHELREPADHTVDVPVVVPPAERLVRRSATKLAVSLLDSIEREGLGLAP